MSLELKIKKKKFSVRQDLSINATKDLILEEAECVSGRDEFVSSRAASSPFG